MKHFSSAIVVLLVLISSLFSQQRIGYINSDAIFDGYSGSKAIEEKLRQFYAQIEKEATERQQRIKQMEKNLEEQSLLLSEDSKLQLQKEINDSTAVYQRFLQDNMGQQGAVSRKQAELMGPVMEKINDVVKQVAEKQNYDLILDTKSGVVYGKPGYDLTEDVISILNKGK